MIGCGLVKGTVIDDGKNGSYVKIAYITWGGLKFLAATRKELLWSEVKEQCRSKGAGLTISFAIETAKRIESEMDEAFFEGLFEFENVRGSVSPILNSEYEENIDDVECFETYAGNEMPSNVFYGKSKE